eukprot:UN01340
MDIPPDSRQAFETVVLKIKAKDLKGDILSKPDCRVAIYMKRSDEKKFNPIAVTELIWNDKSPDFQYQIPVPWSMEQGLQYRAAVFDCDYYFKGQDDPYPKTTKNTHIINGNQFWIYRPQGHVDFAIEDLLSGPVTKPCMSKKGGEVGKSQLTISAVRFPASRKIARIRFKIKKFKKANWLLSSIDKDDMYVQVVANPNTPQEAVVYSTEIVWDTQSPKYKEFALPFGLFGSNLDATFRLDVYRFKSKHGVDLVGRTHTLALAEYLITEKKGDKKKVDAFDPEKMKKDLCDIIFKKFEIVDDPHFNHEWNCNPQGIPKPPAHFAPFQRDFKKH